MKSNLTLFIAALLLISCTSSIKKFDCIKFSTLKGKYKSPIECLPNFTYEIEVLDTIALLVVNNKVVDTLDPCWGCKDEYCIDSSGSTLPYFYPEKYDSLNPASISKGGLCLTGFKNESFIIRVYNGKPILLYYDEQNRKVIELTLSRYKI